MEDPGREDEGYAEEESDEKEQQELQDTAEQHEVNAQRVYYTY